MTVRPRRRVKPRVAPPVPATTFDIDFRSIVESLADIVYTLDLHGRFTYFNPRALEVLGYDPDEGMRFIGRDFGEVFAPGAAAAAVGAIRHRVEHPRDRQVFRVEARHKSGTSILLEVHGGPLVRAGRIVGRVGVCRVLEGADRDDGAAPAPGPHAVQEERIA